MSLLFALLLTAAPAPLAPVAPSRAPAGHGPGAARRPPAAREAPRRLGSSPEAVARTARGYVGTPYVWGGTSRTGMDCSGLVQTVFASHRLALPRVAPDQASRGWAVKPRFIRAGDLLFFTNHLGSGLIEHVGIAVDGQHMVHASTSRMAVVLDRFDSRYYQEHFLFARRVLPRRVAPQPVLAKMRHPETPPSRRPAHAAKGGTAEGYSAPSTRSASDTRR